MSARSGQPKPVPDAAEPAAVLVYVGSDLVGDGLIKLPFVRALRQTYPGTRITWLAGEGRSAFSGALAPLVEALIDEIVDEIPAGTRLVDLLRSPLAGTVLAGRRFDLILDTQRGLLSTLALRRIPHRLFVSATAGFLLSDRKPARPYHKPHSLARQLLDLVEVASGRPPPPFDPIQLDTRFERAADELLPPGPVYVGFAPGAGGRHKCWPRERFAELARRQHAHGRIPVFILGPEEAAWAAPLAQAVPGAAFPLQAPTAARFEDSPMLTITLAHRLAGSITNDSGTGHMLAIADRPLVFVFGPTSPEKFVPLHCAAEVVRAQEFGSSDMTAVPLEAVEAALETALSRPA